MNIYISLYYNHVKWTMILSFSSLVIRQKILVYRLLQAIIIDNNYFSREPLDWGKSTCHLIKLFED